MCIFCNLCPGDYMLLQCITFNNIQGLDKPICHGGYRES